VLTLGRELAVLRAQLPPLLAVHDALVAAAALPGAGASGEEMVAAVRAKASADARADHAAAEECLAAIVRRWERADHDSQSLADMHVPGLRAEIEEARDGRDGEWWER
jgi:predicted lipid-binding transport protein (Tim44 family)